MVDSFSRVSALLATVIVWSLPSLFQFYLLAPSSSVGANFILISVACVADRPFHHLSPSAQRRRTARSSHHLHPVLIQAVPNVVRQIVQTIPPSYVDSGVLARVICVADFLMMLVRVLLHALFFAGRATHSEPVAIPIRRPLLGTLLGAIGVVLSLEQGARLRGTSLYPQVVVTSSAGTLVVGRFPTVLVKHQSTRRRFSFQFAIFEPH